MITSYWEQDWDGNQRLQPVRYRRQESLKAQGVNNQTYTRRRPLAAGLIHSFHPSGIVST